MTMEEFENYLQAFNERDYDAVLDFWTPEFQVIVQGEVLFDSPETLKKGYAFLHEHVSEEVLLDHYLADGDKIFMEARVRIKAFKTITEEAVSEAGINGIMPIEAGEEYDIPQYIHYHLKDGKFKLAVCMVVGPPRPI